MLDLVLVVLLVIILVSYFVYRNNRGQAFETNKIICDPTEDKGFYEYLDPDSLTMYQAALDSIFSLLNAAQFEGNSLRHPLRGEVERLLMEATGNPRIREKYLRVMLCQFLRADRTTRRKVEVFSHWAEQVVELDRQGTHHGSHEIPSAWKVYFNGVMELHDEAGVANP